LVLLLLLSNKRLKGLDVVRVRSIDKVVVGIERGDLEARIEKLRILGLKQAA